MFVDFSNAFDTIHRGKLCEILLVYGIPQETVDAIAMLYKDSKSIVSSPYGDTDFFKITSGVLQGDTLAPYLFSTCSFSSALTTPLEAQLISLVS